MGKGLDAGALVQKWKEGAATDKGVGQSMGNSRRRVLNSARGHPFGLGLDDAHCFAVNKYKVADVATAQRTLAQSDAPAWAEDDLRAKSHLPTSGREVRILLDAGELLGCVQSGLFWGSKRRQEMDNNSKILSTQYSRCPLAMQAWCGKGTSQILGVPCGQGRPLVRR